MYCRHCGEQIDDNCRFCTRCGKKLREDARTSTWRVVAQCVNRKKPTLWFCDGVLLGAFTKIPLVREIPAGTHCFAFYHAVGAFSIYAEQKVNLDGDIRICVSVDAPAEALRIDVGALEEV